MKHHIPESTNSKGLSPFLTRFSRENRSTSNYKSMRTDLYQRHKAENNLLVCEFWEIEEGFWAKEVTFEVDLEWCVVVSSGCKGDKSHLSLKKECAKCCRCKKKCVFREWWEVFGGCWMYKIYIYIIYIKIYIYINKTA